MRLIFPERIPYIGAMLFAIGLCTVQMLEGTSVLFSLGCFFFIMLSTAAFNVAGGLLFPSGAFILFNSLLTLVFGLVAKAVLGEPADSNLQGPVRFIFVYVLGMVSMLVATAITWYFRRSRALLAGIVNDTNLHSAYVGCILVGTLASAALVLLPLEGGSGSFLSFFNQVNQFYGVGLVLGVLWMIRYSNGQRSVGVLAGLAGTYLTLVVVFSYSKQTLFTPLVCWLVPASRMKFRLRWVHIFALVCFTFVVVQYAIPYAQFGRSLEIEGATAWGKAEYLLTHPDVVHQGFAEAQNEEAMVHYFDRQEGLLDRLTMAAVDDALIQNTEVRGEYGYYPLIEQIENLVPHVLWPNKPVVNFGNIWAHEIGILAPEDDFTSVSYSPSAEAYREGGWVGVLLVEPLWLAIVFLILDSVLGDVRENPVGLFMMVLLAHTAPELGLASQIFTASYLLFGVVFVGVLAGTLLPIIGRIFSASAVPQLRQVGQVLLPNDLPTPGGTEVHPS